jgi:hypothetical protein
VTDSEETLRWLAEAGVTPLGEGRWREDDEPDDRSDDDVAYDWAHAITVDDESAPAERIRLLLGLLDLTGQYSITAHLFSYLLAEPDPAVGETLWAGFRSRLEHPGLPEWLRLSLVVDWFEDVRTAEPAFRALLADDVRRLRDRGRLVELAAGPLHHRAAHVLIVSGPVRWEHKRDVYEALASVPELAPALFGALMRCYHNVYGSLEPVAALALLDRLDLPPGTEHLDALPTLRAVLAAGARNNHVDRGLWDRVSGGDGGARA